MVEAAERVVLPGVGTFGAAVAGLRRAGFEAAIAARVRAGRPPSRCASDFKCCFRKARKVLE